MGHLGWALTVETLRCTPTTGPASTSIPAHHNPTKLRGSKAFHRQPLQLQRHASRHRLSSLKSQSAIPRGAREWLHDAQRLSLDFDEPRHENGHDVAMGSWDTRCPTLCSKSKRLLSLADKGRSKIKPTKIPGLHVKKNMSGFWGLLPSRDRQYKSPLGTYSTREHVCPSPRHLPKRLGFFLDDSHLSLPKSKTWKITNKTRHTLFADWIAWQLRHPRAEPTQQSNLRTGQTKLPLGPSLT